jgi:hypothetical protein
VAVVLEALAGGIETREVASEYGLGREDVLEANEICGQDRFFKKVFNLRILILIRKSCPNKEGKSLMVLLWGSAGVLSK